MYSVREVTDKDNEKLLELIEEFTSFIKGLLTGGKWVQLQEKPEIRHGYKYLFAEQDGEPVGYGCYRKTNRADEKSILAEEIYVIPDHRKHGVAKIIFEAIEDKAMVEGARSVVVRVQPRNIGMLDVCSSLGFKVVESVQLRRELGQMAREREKSSDRKFKIFGREFKY